MGPKEKLGGPNKIEGNGIRLFSSSGVGVAGTNPQRELKLERKETPERILAEAARPYGQTGPGLGPQKTTGLTKKHLSDFSWAISSPSLYHTLLTALTCQKKPLHANAGSFLYRDLPCSLCKREKGMLCGNRCVCVTIICNCRLPLSTSLPEPSFIDTLESGIPCPGWLDGSYLSFCYLEEVALLWLQTELGCWGLFTFSHFKIDN